MLETPDRTLLDRFIAARDEAAFRTLVERYLGHVHAVARRVTASDDLARDISQATFIRLAERAALIPADLSLPAWLHRTSHSLAIDLVRAESRRKKRELVSPSHPAAAMDPSSPEPPQPEWSALAPVIDSLVAGLPAAERDVLLLRYYHSQSHAEIARQLGVTEGLSRQRAFRAIERLRLLLGKKGVATTTGALATLLPAHAATPAPVALMTTVAKAAQGVAPLTPHAVHAKFAAMTLLQKSAVAAAALVFLASLGYSVRPGDGGDAALAVMPSAAGGALASDTAARVARTSRRLPSTSEDRLERLRTILAIPLQGERLRELIAYTDLLGPGQFEETATQLRQLAGEDFYTSDAGLVLSSWARIDPQAACAWAAKSAPQALAARMLPVWGDTDPQAALAWLEQHRDELAAIWNNPSLFASALHGLIARDPAAAVKALEVIPGKGDRRSALQVLVQQTLGSQPDAGDRMLAKVDDPELRSELIALSLAEDHPLHPERTLERVLADPGAQEQIEDAGFFFMNWAETDPIAAATYLAKLPDGSKLQRQAVDGVTQYCQPGEAARVADEILKLRDPDTRERGLKMILYSWGKRDSAGATDWVAGKGLSPDVLERIQQGHDSVMH